MHITLYISSIHQDGVLQASQTSRIGRRSISESSPCSRCNYVFLRCFQRHQLSLLQCGHVDPHLGFVAYCSDTHLLILPLRPCGHVHSDDLQDIVCPNNNDSGHRHHHRDRSSGHSNAWNHLDATIPISFIHDNYLSYYRHINGSSTNIYAVSHTDVKPHHRRIEVMAALT
ncbi:hypothetical protein BAUCODRAFT_453951 [Baudoinia panamericana UAMH 10762]|uniref:Uncharacterized protein n=1 Tax=Baudoinia panamericana (strain UAMH 10762) TaxID=717646 RepID=M2NE62_BAUPA|nr:uncharacterized protein BAUCODRAFT_453951 [Baudoinia panamericana UAMH 10762]EMC97494.1 hypothetical protein BAUCODRAFT_453951 [Baudoinia panamericana UAMH 10762]